MGLHLIRSFTANSISIHSTIRKYRSGDVNLIDDIQSILMEKREDVLEHINSHYEKETLKQFYRVLSKKFHPDENPDIDTSKQMTILNRLKDEWGV